MLYRAFGASGSRSDSRADHSVFPSWVTDVYKFSRHLVRAWLGDMVHPNGFLVKPGPWRQWIRLVMYFYASVEKVPKWTFGLPAQWPELIQDRLSRWVLASSN